MQWRKTAVIISTFLILISVGFTTALGALPDLLGHRRMLDCMDSAVILSRGTPWIVDDLRDYAPGGFPALAAQCEKVGSMRLLAVCTTY